MKTPKSEMTTILLAALFGVIGFLGIGHLYVGRIRRGLVLLIGAWALAVASFVCFAVWSMSHMVIPPPGYPKIEVPAYFIAFLALGIILLLGIFFLWIWQIFDARAACTKYNGQTSPPGSNSL